MEVSISNIYADLPNLYLLKKGDTAVFSYKNKLPYAYIRNRRVNDVEINYSTYRIQKLYHNSYTNLKKMSLSSYPGAEKFSYKEGLISNYVHALKKEKEEKLLLDSLKNFGLISQDNYNYRLASIHGYTASKKRLQTIKDWHKLQNIKIGEKALKETIPVSLSQSYKLKKDSLLTFSYFRKYLRDYASNYNISRITENYNNEGGSIYFDSKAKFDSIIVEKNISESARDYLLAATFEEVSQNFTVKDQKEYFQKLKNNISKEHLTILSRRLEMPQSKEPVLRTLATTELTFDELFRDLESKYLFINFMGSWCRPCIESIPDYKLITSKFKEEDIQFITISVKDDLSNWQDLIKKEFKEDTSSHFFLENSGSSVFLEQHSVRFIPRYMVFDNRGKVVIDYALKPGKGVEDQLKNLIE